jgi:hypothetical protein
MYSILVEEENNVSGLLCWYNRASQYVMAKFMKDKAELQMFPHKREKTAK